MNEYDDVIDNGEWLEDKGSRFSRYLHNSQSVWLDHLNCVIVDDPFEAE